MTFQVMIQPRALRAGLAFASRVHGRYAFAGVQVHADGRVVATDGRGLVVVSQAEGLYRDAPEAFQRHGEGSVILGRKDVEAVLKLKPDAVCVNWALVALRAGKHHGPLAEAGRVAYLPVEGEFPDWQAVIKSAAKVADKEGPREPFRLNPGFLADAAKVAGMFEARSGPQYVTIKAGSRSEGVTLTAKDADGEALMLIMPIAS